MLAQLLAHKDVILMALLTISEVMALVFPSAGGIVAGIVQGLKALGAKDVDGK